MVERKLFLQILCINIIYPNVENLIVAPIPKRVEIIMCIRVCRISRMNFDYTKNDGNKAFLANQKHQYHVSQYGEKDYCANNKKNGDYYEYPSLSPFSNKLWLKEKWWKEKVFLQIQSINILSPIMESMIAMPITKGMEIVMVI